MVGSKNLVLTLTATLATFVAVGCGGDKEPANSAQASQCPSGQYFDGRFCQNLQPASGATPAPGAQPGTAAPGTGAPAPTLPVATAAVGSPATPLDATAASAATQLLGALATQHAMAGAKPVGPALAGNFQQGQQLEAQVQMNPGKCYTVVGAGVPTIQNLDIQLVPAISIPGLPAAVAAADQSQGPTAVVGEKPNCFKWALPVGGTMKVVMSVSAGQGVAAAQVYEK
jgi:hypothetical protein